MVARIDKDLADWLSREFPHGFKQMYIEKCLENLRMLVEEGIMPPPSEFARKASLDAVKKLAN